MARYGVIDLIWFLALINVNLAIFNLLPIPVLDGGHMMFATIGKLMGRPVPRKVMELSYTACIMVLLSFMIYVSFFDVKRVGKDAGLISDEIPTLSADSTSEDMPTGEAPSAQPE